MTFTRTDFENPQEVEMLEKVIKYEREHGARMTKEDFIRQIHETYLAWLHEHDDMKKPDLVPLVEEYTKSVVKNILDT